MASSPSSTSPSPPPPRVHGTASAGTLLDPAPHTGPLSRATERELFGDLASKAPGPQLVALAVGALALFALRPHIPLAAGLTWFALLAAVTALRVLGPLRTGGDERIRPATRLRVHGLLTLVAGVLWGALPWLPGPDFSFGDMFLVAVALFVLVGGAVETYSLLPGQFEAFVWPAGGSLAVRLLAAGDGRAATAGTVTVIFLIFMTTVAVRRRRRTADLEAVDRLFTALHRAATRPEADTQDAFEPLLAAGCSYLGLDLGIVSEIRGDEYRVLAVHSLSTAAGPPSEGEAPPASGAVLALEDTVCAYTIRAEGPVSYARDAPPGIRHPAYREHAPAYIGHAIIVDGAPFGTINFSDPRRTRFRVTPFQREMIELLADWLGTELGRRRAEARRQRERSALELLTDSIPALIAYIAPDLTYRYVNSQYEKLFGRSRETFRGVSVASLAGEAAFAQIRPHLERAMAGEEQTFEVSPDLEPVGHRPTFIVHYVPDRAEDGSVRGCFALLSEITPYKVAETQLREQARRDFLTGLLNRRAFFDAVAERLADQRKRAADDFICYLDLDGFKQVNDTCGHGAGDEALRRLAGVMREAVRSSDVLARLGGDEFGLLLVACTEEEARRHLESLAARIRSERFTWQGRQFELRASIGATALSSADGDTAEGAAGSEETVRALIRTADEACYRAKRDPDRSVVLAGDGSSPGF